MALRNLFQDRGVSEKLASFSPFQNMQKDFGVSERIGKFLLGNDANAQVFQVGEGLNQSPTAVQQRGQVLGSQTAQNQTFAPPIQNQSIAPPNPAGGQPLGGSGGGAGAAPSNSLSAGGQVAGATTDQAYQDEQNRLNAEAEKRSSQFRDQASSIFNPLISNADTQIGRLSSELGQLTGGVERGAEASRGLVGSQLAQSLNTLGQQESNVRGETQKSLRSLAEDQRNTTTSLARQLGARGAGDTSAGDYASAAIGRQGLKQRGSALESQATGLREIEGRRVQSQEIANQEYNRIEQAKQQQLTSLTQDFQNLTRQLENAKAMASSDERRFIAEQQNQLQAELSQRLSDLDGEARQRKAALSDWFTMQETQLQNSLRQLSGAAQIDLSNPLKTIGAAGQLGASFNFSPTEQSGNQLLQTLTPGVQYEKEKEEDEGDSLQSLIELAKTL